MSKLGLFILLLVSSKTVFVASQQWCSRNDDCDANGCCNQGSCTTNQLICMLKKKEEELKTCYSDWQCTGCCYESKCHPKSSYHCSKSCNWSWDCDSGCCNNGKCQTSYECDSYSYTTTRAAWTSCYRNSQCDSGCCKYGLCRESYECESYFDTTTTATPRTSCYLNNQCDSGCCNHGLCQESYECYNYFDTTTAPRKSCLSNYGCDSGCCKNYMCQESYDCDYSTGIGTAISVHIYIHFNCHPKPLVNSGKDNSQTLCFSYFTILHSL